MIRKYLTIILGAAVLTACGNVAYQGSKQEPTATSDAELIDKANSIRTQAASALSRPQSPIEPNCDADRSDDEILADVVARIKKMAELADQIEKDLASKGIDLTPPGGKTLSQITAELLDRITNDQDFRRFTVEAEKRLCALIQSGQLPPLPNGPPPPIQ